MNIYTERVADNILPLSQAGTLPDAFKEWYFAGRTEDHEQAIEECQLCNQEQLRYHFEIKNRYVLALHWKAIGSLPKRNGVSVISSMINKLRYVIV